MSNGPSQGQIEAAIGVLVTRFFREMVGHGPRSVSVTLRPHALFIHLQGALTKVEERMVRCPSSDAQRCAAMVREMRDHLVRQGRESLMAALAGTLGHPPHGMMHDLNAETGEEVIVFSLSVPVEASARRA